MRSSVSIQGGRLRAPERSVGHIARAWETKVCYAWDEQRLWNQCRGQLEHVGSAAAHLSLTGLHKLHTCCRSTQRATFHFEILAL
jgi:hypothetical protein